MDPYFYHTRDISWLAFNHRVLQEATDKNVPLYERIKFLAIYSSNLDEFYRVRVSYLRSFKALRKKEDIYAEISPKKELKAIRKTVHHQQVEFGIIFRSQILPGLKSHHIHLIHKEQYSADQKRYLNQYFEEKIRPLIVARIVEEPVDQPPFLQNQGLYLVAELDGARLALLEIPSHEHDRFLKLPSPGGEFHYTWIDDILRYKLPELLGEPIEAVYAIKLSRDAELYIEDEFSGDLLEKIRRSLKERTIGLPTRFLYDSEMPIEMVKRLKQIFRLRKNDLFPGGRYHNLNDLHQLPNPYPDGRLQDEALPPLPHPHLEDATSLIDSILEQDRILHFPYQRYGYVPRLIHEAANNVAVIYIKITLYRVASKSAVVTSLLEALAKGKEVVVFIEAKARFDEESNLYWGERLEQAGAKVLYSNPGIKVHTKLLLIGIQRRTDLQHIAYLGTGNFNEKTARIYCDHALLTSDLRLTEGVAQIFSHLEKKIDRPKSEHLFVSPFTTRERFEHLVRKEIKNARAGKKAYLILKMNSLEDTGLINLLYEASGAGVDIQLIVRGICRLVPGVAGMSENIQVISIIDRFLEHARVYIFGNKGKEKMYIASADWMTRNLDKRIEVVFPIYDPRIFQEFREIIDLQLADNVKARFINASLSNPYRQCGPEETAVRAQTAIYWMLHGRLQEQKAKTISKEGNPTG